MGLAVVWLRFMPQLLFWWCIRQNASNMKRQNASISVQLPQRSLASAPCNSGCCRPSDHACRVEFDDGGQRFLKSECLQWRNAFLLAQSGWMSTGAIQTAI